MDPCPFPKRYPSLLSTDDSTWISHAFNEAIDAWNEGEVPVGAVIVAEGRIIARAHNQVEVQRDPTAHAEMIAITQAAAARRNWRLTGCTLYVTKEPCPMCAGATVMSRLDRVVYALPDPRMGGLGGAFDVNAVPGLLHHLTVDRGPLEHECRALFQGFFQARRALPPEPRNDDNDVNDVTAEERGGREWPATNG